MDNSNPHIATVNKIKKKKYKSMLHLLQDSPLYSRFDKFIVDKNEYTVYTYVKLSPYDLAKVCYKCMSYIDSPNIMYDVEVESDITYDTEHDILSAIKQGSFIVDLERTHRHGIKKLEKVLDKISKDGCAYY